MALRTEPPRWASLPKGQAQLQLGLDQPHYRLNPLRILFVLRMLCLLLGQQRRVQLRLLSMMPQRTRARSMRDLLSRNLLRIRRPEMMRMKGMPKLIVLSV
jgi:hypothetical protein